MEEFPIHQLMKHKIGVAQGDLSIMLRNKNQDKNKNEFF